MKLSAATLALAMASASAFSPAGSFARQSTKVFINRGEYNMDMSGNSWKPDSAKMGSTDTGDYLPEGYNPDEEIAFTSGMMGSQQMLTGGNRSGPELPGMENLGADAIMMGGIEENTDIPAGMQFIPSSVPDGEVTFQVSSTAPSGGTQIAVKPICMGFEDYYAAFSPDSDPAFKVTPCAGRMDRRGGDPTILQIICEPNGRGGELKGNLVINLPEDNSKICYKVTAQSL